MNGPNRNLALRIASVVVLLPLVLALVYFGGVWSMALMSAAAGACAGEYLLIVSNAGGAEAGAGGGGKLDLQSSVGILTAAVLPIWPWVLPARAGEAAFATLAIAFLAAWISSLARPPLAQAPSRAAHLLTAAAYGGVGVYALSAVRAGPHGLQWLVAAMTVTWANDTMAYFGGRVLGRHKLYPEVSPNKTWEGFFAGFVGSVGGLFIARAVFASELTPRDCVVLGVLGGVLGPLGDLCESMLKRAYGVKDSSQLIPGHGGVLDRIDALLFNGPLVLLYVRYARDLWGG